ncbi:hypothetical protein R5W24_000466 [Gemmata sp. JC717]|uniref:hypothetical protein n=1 Tax=Gemmata algarum TaxID=2975278 RepID=UPI0021BA756C|nr:hypothetical protein [Gemmata algarum]MDY3551390.1 hypothetical protein [Gemmata algarum]
MTAKRLDITIEQGADFVRDFPVAAANGAPFDISGYRAALQVRAAPGAPTALVTLTSDNGGLALVSGRVRAAIQEAVTADLSPGAYVYDLKLVSPAGFTSRWYEGACTVAPQVTTFDFPAPNPSPSDGQLNFSSASNSAYAAII